MLKLMTIDASGGNRAAHQPKTNPIANWMNNLVVGRIRHKGGFMGMTVLVVNTVGKNTGRQRSTPVAWFPGEDGTWLIVASDGGSPRNPAWFHNIAANPDAVSIDVDRARVAVVATELRGTERESAWASITTASPSFKRYARKTDRLIPVLHLARRK